MVDVVRGFVWPPIKSRRLQDGRCLLADFQCKSLLRFTFATSQSAERNMSTPLKIFIIYAREDESFKNSLLTAFIPLRRAGKIEVFHDALIKPGDRWEDVILENLRTAHIILPLVSNDFFASEFIHEVEFKKAVDRYNRGETAIIPVILKHCGWKYDPVIKTLQVLPKDGKPVVTWAFHEEAWEQILDAVNRVTEQAEEKKREEKEAEAKRKKEEAEAKRKKEQEEKKRFEGDLIRREEAEERIKRAREWYKGGIANSVFGKYGPAKYHFNQAIMLDPKLASAYYHRGLANEKLGYYSEARWDYKKSLSIDPNNEDAKNNLKNLEEKTKKKRWFWE